MSVEGTFARAWVGVSAPVAPQLASTANKGWSSYPGPQRGYRIRFDGKSRTRETVGNISPQPQLFQTWFGFAEDGGLKLVDISAEDISRHVLLTQLGARSRTLW